MFIVNVGDQLQAYTNDLLVSTGHRVLNWSGRERLSIPFFFSMNFEAVVEPIPELVEKAKRTGGHVACHPPVTAGEVRESLHFHYIYTRLTSWVVQMYKMMKVSYHQNTTGLAKAKNLI